MVIAQLIGILIGCCIGSLIGAIILRAAAKWVQKLDVGFGNAYVTVLLASVVNSILGFIVGFVIGAASQSMDAVNTASVLMFPVGFLVQSGIVSSRLQISFGRGCLVSLVMCGIGIGIVLAVGVIFFIVTAIL